MNAIIRASTVRVGAKRLVATGAEALRRWAIDQGTLPRAEGGTQLAPIVRLGGLLEDPACALPLAALSPGELAALRQRRQAAGPAAAVLAEQASLASAIQTFCEFFQLALPHPFAAVAPDAWSILGQERYAQLRGLARRVDPTLELALELLWATAAEPAELAACLQQDIDRASRSLLLPGRQVALSPALFRRLPQGGPTGARLLPGLAAGRLEAWLAEPSAGSGGTVRRAADRSLAIAPQALRLGALVARLQAGSHLDEILPLIPYDWDPGRPRPALVDLPPHWSDA
ncbi:hypothetical protein [Belnapia moabensis]|uniref:hypothetical protein n=1 Tax=Belnapia moabensis TaxID=365533 RepID=UPI0005BB02BA|nr:hypothetical protein [Belnapia moabensis]